jgi:hypothetical protein
MLHQKADGVSAFATAETLENFLGRGNSKGRRLLVVKRTIAQIIRPSLFEFNKASNDINDINPALDLLYGILADQGGKFTHFSPILA